MNGKRNRKRNRNKTIRRIVGIAAFLAVAALLIGSLEYKTRYKISDIDSSVSPGGEYKVMYQNIGEPDFPFGYAHARLVLKQGKDTVAQYRFDVANDGGVPTATQWSVDWKDDCAQVTISGDEQQDILYTLFYNGSTAWTELETRSAN